MLGRQTDEARNRNDIGSLIGASVPRVTAAVATLHTADR